MSEPDKLSAKLRALREYNENLKKILSSRQQQQQQQQQPSFSVSNPAAASATNVDTLQTPGQPQKQVSSSDPQFLSPIPHSHSTLANAPLSSSSSSSSSSNVGSAGGIQDTVPPPPERPSPRRSEVSEGRTSPGRDASMTQQSDRTSPRSSSARLNSSLTIQEKIGDTQADQLRYLREENARLRSILSSSSSESRDETILSLLAANSSLLDQLDAALTDRVSLLEMAFHTAKDVETRFDNERKTWEEDRSHLVAEVELLRNSHRSPGATESDRTTAARSTESAEMSRVRSEVLSELSQRTQTLADRNAQLLRELSASSDHVRAVRDSMAAQVAIMRKDRDDLKVRVGELLGAVSGKDSVIARLENQLQKERLRQTEQEDDEQHDTTAYVDNHWMKVVDEWKNRVLQLQAENDQLRSQKETTVASNRALAFNVNDSSLTQMTAENAALRASITSLTQQSEGLRHSLNIQTRSLRDSQTQLSLVEAELNSVRSSSDERVRLLESSVAHRHSEWDQLVRSLRSELNEKTAEVRSLRDQLLRSQASQSSTIVVHQMPVEHAENSPVISKEPTPSSAVSDGTVWKVRERILEDKIAALQRETDRIEEALSVSEQERHATVTRMDAISFQLAEKESQVEALQNELRSSQAHVRILEAQQSIVTDAAQQHEGSVKKSSDSPARDDRASKASAFAEQLAAQIKEKDRSLAQLRAEHDELLVQLQSLQREKLRAQHDFAEQRSDLMNQISNLQTMISESRAREGILQGTIDDLEAQIANFRNEHDKLNNSVVTATHEKHEFENSKREAVRQLSELESENLNLSSLVSSLQAAVHSLTSEKNKYEGDAISTRNDYLTLERRYNDLVEEKCTDSESFATFKEQSEHARLQIVNRLDTTISHLDAVSLQLEKCKNENAHLKRQLGVSEEDIQSERAEKESHVRKYRTMLEETETRLRQIGEEKDSMVREFTSRETGYKLALTEASAQLQKLVDEKNVMSRDLQDALEKHERENEEWRSRVLAIEVDKSRSVSEWESSSQEWEAKYSHLHADHMALLTEHEISTHHNEQILRQCESLQRELSNTRVELENSTKALLQTRAQLDVSERAKNDWISAHDSLKQQMQNLVESHASESDRILEDIQSERERTAVLSETLEKVRKERDGYFANVESLRSQTKTLLDEMAAQKDNFDSQMAARDSDVANARSAWRDERLQLVTQHRQEIESLLNSKESEKAMALSELSRERDQELFCRVTDLERRLSEECRKKESLEQDFRDLAENKRIEIDTLKRAIFISDETVKKMEDERRFESQMHAEENQRKQDLIRSLEGSLHQLEEHYRVETQNRQMEYARAVQQLEDQLTSAHSAMSEHENSHLDAAHQKDNMIADLRSQCIRLDATVSALQASLSQSKSQFDQDLAQSREMHESRCNDLLRQKNDAVEYSRMLQDQREDTIRDFGERVRVLEEEKLVLAHKNSNLRRLLQNLKNDFTSVNATLADLVEKKLEAVNVPRLRKEYETLAASHAQTLDELHRMQLLVSEHRSADDSLMTTLQNENLKIKVALKAAEDRVSALESQKTALEVANRGLSDRIRSLSSRQEESSELMMSSVKSKILALEDELRSTKDSNVQLKEEVDKVRAQNRSLVLTIGDSDQTMQTRISQMESLASSLQSENLMLKGIVQESQEKLSASIRECDVLREHISDMKAQSGRSFAELTERSSSLEREIESLKDRLEREQRRKYESEKKERALLSEYEKSRDLLRLDYGAQVEATRREKDSVERRFATLQKEYDALKLEHSRIVQYVNKQSSVVTPVEVAAAAREHTPEMEAQMDIMRRDLVSLEEALMDEKTQHERTKLKARDLMSEVARLEASLAQSRASVGATKHIVPASTSSSPVKSSVPGMDEEMSKLASTNGILSSRVDELSHQLSLKHAELEALRNTLSNEQSTRISLQEQLKASKRQQDSQINLLTADLTRLQHEISASHSERDVAIIKAQQLQQTVDTLVRAQTNAESDVRRLTDELSRIRSERDALAGQIDAARRDADYVSTSLDELERDRRRILAVVSEQQRRNDDLTARLRHVEVERRVGMDTARAGSDSTYSSGFPSPLPLDVAVPADSNSPTRYSHDAHKETKILHKRMVELEQESSAHADSLFASSGQEHVHANHNQTVSSGRHVV
eukprot:ANDGO_07499.mRNA.1 hypothetical protein